MKERNLLREWFFTFMIMVGGLCTQGLSAQENTEDIPLDGDWNQGARLIFPGIPIIASIEGNILSIQSSSNRSDITIRITNGSKTMYKQKVTANETSQIFIDLSSFDNKLYVLEISNQWGDFLYGDFAKY